MNELMQETQQSYYEYVIRIEQGCHQIANMLRIGQQADALQMIIDLSEGMGWLVSVEHYMIEQNYKVNSQTKEALVMLNEINHALEISDFVTVADLFEYEIAPLFASASEWIFEKVEN
ncbi:hypothetical protein [Lysinibacillus capsici]|uniref:hypothetical protein n=1 Tax=Lysinibacillus capsici TaxID=2115968 RepID=UPI0034E4873E